MENRTTENSDTRRAVRLAAVLTLLLSGIGVLGIWQIRRLELWRQNIAFEQFSEIEAPGIAIVAAFAIAVLVMLSRASLADPEASGPMPSARVADRIAFATVALVFLLTAAGTQLAFDAYPFVDDEFSGRFQAAIYASGERAGIVPPEWCPWIGALTPTSIFTHSARCTWELGYFPVNAMIAAGFEWAGAVWLANPTMAAITILLAYLTARRAWPDRPDRAVLTIVILAASTQFLLMTMSAFSMPAHLLASSLWLWLYVRPERWALALLPVVGVVALGVHSPYPHVLFVAPFVVSFLLRRRFGAFIYLSIVYAAGALAWVEWGYPTVDRAVNAASAPSAATLITNTAGGLFSRPNGDGIGTAVSTTVLATWNVPIAFLGVIVALLLWQRLDRLARWLAASLLCTLIVRAIFFPHYGAGWGHRYAYAALVNFAMLAAIGFEFITEAIGRRAGRALAATTLLTAVLLEIPMRGVQASRIVAPYVAASRFLESIPADAVLVQFESLRWGRQLLRNDPFLRNTPKLVSFSELSREARDSLERAFPGRVRHVRLEELEALGVRRSSRIGRFEIR